MIGNNELHLNLATMMMVVQEFIDRRYPQMGVDVCGIRKIDTTFVVSVKEREKKETSA